MVLEQITILNYKNIKQADLSFSTKLNCFVGFNGVGKTNVLDAIYYLSFCRSAFNTTDQQTIHHEADVLVLQGKYLNNQGQEENYYCGLERDKRKVFKRNGKEYGRLSEHIGRLPIVMISPSDIELILGGSEERRRFMDMVISQYDATYLYEVIRYRKALKQRNLLLKQDHVDADFISIYEEVMADAGTKVYHTRKNFLEAFVPVFQNIYCQLADKEEQVALNYKTNCKEGSLLQDLQEWREREKIVGHSLMGVHRDDLEMTLGGYPIRHEGSQGQNKTYLAALKLAQFEFLRDKNQQVPILLLDDIFDKLDSSRVAKILKLVSKPIYGQIFITDTDRNFIADIISQTGMDAHIFEIEEGGNIHAI